MTGSRVFRNGVFRDNPVAVMAVGLCPAAAVTGRVIDALWMSLGLLFVLLLTRFCQAALRTLRAPDLSSPPGPVPVAFAGPTAAPLGLRWLGSLLLASSFTAAFELILLAFAPDESASLGIYVPLLAVNCLVLDRFERSGPAAMPQSPWREVARSLQDAAGLGVGFAICLVAISVVREALGSGTITLFPVGSFGGTIEVGKLSGAPMRALVYAGGGLLCLGYLAGAARLLRRFGGQRSGSETPGRAEAGRV
jgi:H+/Na+-translocating ferredoxin:NAD+ oxidoreductase subunit E